MKSVCNKKETELFLLLCLGIQDTLADDLSDEDDDGFIDFDNLGTNNFE